MVMPCSRSASRPSTSKAKSISSLGGAVFLRIAFERGKLIVENQMLFVEQPADQRGLAVIDRAAGQKAMDACGSERRCRTASFIRSSPPASSSPSTPASSLSIKRPCRSDLVAARISAMMSSSVSASDSMAPVKRIAAERPEPHTRHSRAARPARAAGGRHRP